MRNHHHPIPKSCQSKIDQRQQPTSIRWPTSWRRIFSG